MAVHSGPKIVDAGLIVNLDAGNSLSYPGSGVNWSDMSGNGNNCTLLSSVVSYVTAGNINAIQFNGGHAAIAVQQLATATTITVEGFIRWDATNTNGMVLGFTSSYDVWTNGNTLGYNNGASNVIGINAAAVTSLGLINNFRHYTFVMNSSGLLSANKIYINGVLQSMTAVQGADGNAPGFGAGVLRLCTWQNASGYFGKMTYPGVRVYNRELTQAEINQNFNAQRKRYGI